MIATSDQQTADHDRADAVPDAVAGQQREPDAEQREHQTDQRGGVLKQHDRKLGHPRVADECDPVALPRILLVSWIAVRNE